MRCLDERRYYVYSCFKEIFEGGSQMMRLTVNDRLYQKMTEEQESQDLWL